MSMLDDNRGLLDRRVTAASITIEIDYRPASDRAYMLLTACINF